MSLWIIALLGVISVFGGLFLLITSGVADPEGRGNGWGMISGAVVFLAGFVGILYAAIKPLWDLVTRWF